MGTKLPTGSISVETGSHEALTPKHGKATFHGRMEREMAHVKRLYPEARWIGIADGAPGNWKFLGPHVPPPNATQRMVGGTLFAAQA